MRSTREASATVRVRLDITGVVQGVGFRPAVARIAAPTVSPDSSTTTRVRCTANSKASRGRVDAAVADIRGAPPPMARIDDVRGDDRGAAGRQRLSRSSPARDRRRLPAHWCRPTSQCATTACAR